MFNALQKKIGEASLFSCVVSSHVPLSEKKGLLDLMLSRIQFNFAPGAGVGGGGTQYNGLYGEWRGSALEGLLLQASGVRKSSGFH